MHALSMPPLPTCCSILSILQPLLELLHCCLILTPSLCCYPIGVVSKEILLKDRVRPPVGVSFKRPALSHLAVSFSLFFAIIHMCDGSICSAFTNNSSRSWLSKLLVDPQGVTDLGFVFGSLKEGADNCSILHCLSGSLSPMRMLAVNCKVSQFPHR
jgi:hypothetical protein